MPPIDSTPSRIRRALSVAAIVATIASTAACAPDTAAAPSPANTDPQEPSSMPDADTYEDGEYTARGWYGSKPSHHDVTLTIEDGIVSDVSITTPAEDETSLGYQQRFAEALPDAIIGQSIDELNVDRLAGSSGCSEGFMDALAQIRDDAQQ